MSKSQVSIAKGADPEKLLTEVLAPLGGIKTLIKPKTTVMIKPNAGHEAPPESSVNTNPELVAALIRELRKAGPKEITVRRKKYEIRIRKESVSIKQPCCWLQR